MERVEVVIVGGGLAGLSTALVLAEAGVEVLVVERGDYPGSKNVTGGRLYLEPVKPFFPTELWDDAPFERQVVHERLTVVAPESSITVELSSERFKHERHSFTLLRATFDRWLAEQASARGAFVVSGYKVDGLLMDGDRVRGIRSGEADVQADVVVSAEGILGFLAQEAGLRGVMDPKHYALGVKEIIELPAERIEERFGLENEQGAAHLLFGSVTHGMTGGGFLYTNKESLSLGMVISMHDLMHQDYQGAPVDPHDMMEAFKARPEIHPLIKDGHPVEYSAHTIIEGGINAVGKLYRDGMLVVGDAAGFSQNLGITVRGMDFALASGATAAQAILHARRKGDFSARTLAIYESLLQDTFVLRDLDTFKHLPGFLENPRLFGLYPKVLSDLFEELFWFGQHPKQKLSTTAFRSLRKKLLGKGILKDLLAARRAL
ncbi:MAG: FAD-dependent oxidoreductase [Anaerolineales bacterium]|nr:FAD-dependent oxidoreductase [Anaerolineales bacterium]